MIASSFAVGLAYLDVNAFIDKSRFVRNIEWMHCCCWSQSGGINMFANDHIECKTYAINIPEKINVNDGRFILNYFMF